MKKNLLSVIILAFLIINIVLTSIMMFSVMGTNKKTGELVTNIATVLKLELTEPGEVVVPDVKLKNAVIYTFEKSTRIALESDEDGEHYITFNLTIMMNSKHKDYKTYGETISEKETLMKDALATALSSFTVEECKADKETLKSTMLKAVQSVFNSDFIYKVAISEETYL